MVRRIRKSTLFSLIAVIALLSLGIGYAAWTETLTINGTVDTADFDVDWDNALATETADPLSAGTCVINAGSPSDVAPGDDNLLEATLDNTYPGYSCEITVDIVNNSTIPVKLTNYVELAAGVSGDATYSGALDIDPFECLDGGTAISVGDTIAAGAIVNCTFGVEVTALSDPSTTYYPGASADFVVP